LLCKQQPSNGSSTTYRYIAFAIIHTNQTKMKKVYDYQMLLFKCKAYGLEKAAKLIVFVNNVNTNSLPMTRKKQIYSKVNDLVLIIEQREEIQQAIADELNLLSSLGLKFNPDKVKL
jgi:nitrate reductase NapAB chaperone NapD